MYSTNIFPSVLEGNNRELHRVSQDLLNGLKIYTNGSSYIIGNLALLQGISPHRTVNCSPDELEYKLLLDAGILIANYNHNRPIYLTLGFPFSTYTVNKQMAKKVALGMKKIEFAPSTFGYKDNRDSIMVQVLDVDVLPEMMGNIIALRKGAYKATGNFFVISLGYGTLEAILSTDNGVIQRTAISNFGIQYAIDLFTTELSKENYLGLKNKKQLDVLFQENTLILNRKHIDITEIKRKVLQQYYHEVVSPSLRSAFTDNDFNISRHMFITGGGALYSDLINCFSNEFKDITNIEVVDNPLTLTSIGYCLNSLDLTGGIKNGAIGLDIGNANTVVTQFNSSIF